MTAFESMSEKLSKTGLYRTDEGCLIYAELMAYASGLDLYYDALDELLRECFVITAESYGLELREKLIKKCNVDDSIEGRRKSILAALSITVNDFTSSGFYKCLDIFNINGTFTADFQNKIITVYLQSLEDTEKTEKIRQQLSEFLPPQFTVEFSAAS